MPSSFVICNYTVRLFFFQALSLRGPLIQTNQSTASFVIHVLYLRTQRKTKTRTSLGGRLDIGFGSGAMVLGLRISFFAITGCGEGGLSTRQRKKTEVILAEEAGRREADIEKR